MIQGTGMKQQRPKLSDAFAPPDRESHVSTPHSIEKSDKKDSIIPQKTNIINETSPEAQTTPIQSQPNQTETALPTNPSASSNTSTHITILGNSGHTSIVPVRAEFLRLQGFFLTFIFRLSID